MGITQRNVLIKRRIKHAFHRFKERHGIFLDDFEYCSLVNQIITSQSIFIVRFSRNFTMHKVLYRNEWVPVVYSKRHKLILTVYQNGWVKKNHDGTYFIKPKKKPKRKKPREQRVPWQLKKKWNKAKREEMGII